MSFTRVSGFTKFMAFPTGIIGSDDPINIADILSTRSIGNFGLGAVIRQNSVNVCVSDEAAVNTVISL